MEFIIFILLTSTAICGLYLAGKPGMLLSPIAAFFEGMYLKIDNVCEGLTPKQEKKRIRLQKIGMPIILCPTCMASVWGITSYWLYFGCLDLMTVYCVLSLAFVNSLLIELYELIRRF